MSPTAASCSPGVFWQSNPRTGMPRDFNSATTAWPIRPAEPTTRTVLLLFMGSTRRRSAQKNPPIPDSWDKDGSVLTTAAVAARTSVEILLLGHAAQFKGLGDKLGDRFLYCVHGLLRFEKALRDGAVEEGLAPLFEVGNLRHVERRACLLLVL